jgi:hypothetical protein
VGSKTKTATHIAEHQHAVVLGDERQERRRDVDDALVEANLALRGDFHNLLQQATV